MYNIKTLHFFTLFGSQHSFRNEKLSNAHNPKTCPFILNRMSWHENEYYLSKPRINSSNSIHAQCSCMRGLDGIKYMKIWLLQFISLIPCKAEWIVYSKMALHYPTYHERQIHHMIDFWGPYLKIESPHLYQHFILLIHPSSHWWFPQVKNIHLWALKWFMFWLNLKFLLTVIATL